MPPSRPRVSRSNPTQKDIAKALGISQASVAYALNPKSRGKLLPETVSLIQAKADELNYRPQRQASILRSGRSHTIAAIFLSGTYHAPQEKVKYLAQSAIGAGYQLIAMDLDWFQRDFKAAQNYLVGSAVEGVVFCNLPEETQRPWEPFLKERSLPAISLSSTFAAAANRVDADLKDSFRQMTEHHLALGSRRLTLLLPYYDRPEVDYLESEPVFQRASGFIEAILAAGGEVVTRNTTNGAVLNLCRGLSKKKAPITGTVIHPVKTDDFRDVFELGFFQTCQMLRSGRPLPQSLICSNDQVASGAVNACLRNGVDVPGQIRISGADDAPFSRFCGIPLTTIAQPSEAMAQWSIKRIVELIENPELREKPAAQSFPCKLICRASTLGTPAQES